MSENNSKYHKNRNKSQIQLSVGGPHSSFSSKTKSLNPDSFHLFSRGKEREEEQRDPQERRASRKFFACNK